MQQDLLLRLLLRRTKAGDVQCRVSCMSLLHTVLAARWFGKTFWPPFICFPFVDTLLSLIILYEFFINEGAQQRQEQEQQQ